MSALAVWLALGAAIVVLASFIPGMKLIVDPIIKLVFMVISEITTNGMEWAIWAVKRLYRAHANIFTNLITTRADLDPTERVRNKQ